MNIFTDKTYQDYYAALFGELTLKITTESDDYIIATPTDDLVKFYYSGNILNPIEFDPDKEESIDHEKYIKTIPAHQREWRYQHEGDLRIECEKIIATIPIITNNDVDTIFNLRTQTIIISGRPEFLIDRNRVVLEIEIKGYGVNLTNEQISSYISKNRSEVENLVNSKNEEIRQENEKLKVNLTQFITERKQKLDSDRNRLENLVKLIKIPLARKDSEIVKKIQIEEKPFIKKIKPKATSEDYQLDRDKVIDIIRLISSQCLQFEKMPATYDKLDEPNLRDLLLSNLNSIFEGKATGETFNNKGKTDIYLNIDKGNILVAECKFYGGEKLYHKTIEQLVGYLTWRQNFGIMINFCKQKNFSKILGDVQSIVTSHSTYDSAFKTIDKSHYISKHTLPTDEYKYVEIHHLYYNLYYE